MLSFRNLTFNKKKIVRGNFQTLIISKLYFKNETKTSTFLVQIIVYEFSELKNISNRMSYTVYSL